VLLDNRIRSFDRISDVIAMIVENIDAQAPTPSFTPTLVTLNNTLVGLLSDNPSINFVPGTVDASGDLIQLRVKNCNSCFTNTLNTTTLFFRNQTNSIIPLSAVTEGTVYDESYCYLVGTKLANWIDDSKAILQKIKECCCPPV